MANGYVTKGSRIRAQWFQAVDPPASLAGMQLKFGATKFDVVGIVRHVRGDHPTAPTQIRFYIDPVGDWDGPTTRPPGCTCANAHVEVNPDHVIAEESGHG